MSSRAAPPPLASSKGSPARALFQALMGLERLLQGQGSGRLPEVTAQAQSAGRRSRRSWGAIPYGLAGQVDRAQERQLGERQAHIAGVGGSAPRGLHASL